MVVGSGFSFDWGLIQPELARSTTVCTYDPSGTAWSDPFPQTSPSCSERVQELHQVLKRASVAGPYVIVGFSIGGLYARLFAHDYPEDVSGMVIVDHAFAAADRDNNRPRATSQMDSPPVLIFQPPIVLGMEDDQNFARLPRRNRELHEWAMSRHPVRPTPEGAAECAGVIENATADQTAPLGSKPLVVVSTTNQSRGYAELQAKLLSLSRNSKQAIAERSFHMVIIDQPEIVVSAIADVVAAVRSDKLRD